MDKIKNCKDIESVCWVQEEPRNRGGYLFMKDLLYETADINLAYTGLGPSASPATGHYSKHTAEYKRIIEEAFSMPEKGSKS